MSGMACMSAGDERTDVSVVGGLGVNLGNPFVA